MLIITGGCSFTAHEIEENLSWAYQLAELPGYEVVNTATMASGNGLISRNVLSALSEYKNVTPVVMIMWSSPNRFELFYDKNHPIQKEMQNHPAFYNNTWLKSGGGYGHWTFGSPIADKHTKIYLKQYHNQEYQFMQTLEHILRVQWYCQINNIKLYNLCWQNIFYGNNSKDGSSYKNLSLDKKKSSKPIIEQFPSCQHLWDMINWDNWHLYNRGGLWEFCIDKGYKIPHGLHPSAEAQRQYLDEIVVPLLDR